MARPPTPPPWLTQLAALAAAAVEALRSLQVAAARSVPEASPASIFSLNGNSGESSMILSAAIHRLATHAALARHALNNVGGCVPVQLQQRRYLAGRATRRNYRRGDEEHDQKQQCQKSSVSGRQGGGQHVCAEARSVVDRVLEASQRDPDSLCGSSFWASQREEVMSSVKEGKLSLATAAVLVAAFSKAGELTGPLATAVAKRLCTGFRAAARGGVSPLLLREECVPLEEGLAKGTGETDFRVHFSDGATVLLAMKEAGLLQDPCAGVAARDLQEALLLCVQPQWNCMTFMQLRRLFLLLGATAEPLGLDMATARELLTAAKRHLRKMQKSSGRLFEEGDARDTIVLVWPLATISAALGIPAPQISSSFDASLSSLACSSCSNEDMKMLQRDRDIVLQLVRTQGFAGLQRLGQQKCAEYVLAAFSAAAAAASCEELCRLGRDILLAGAHQKALWEAFADAIQTVAEQRQQTLPCTQHSNCSHEIEAALSQWLRFCGRTIKAHQT